MCIHFYSIGSYRYYRSEPSGFRITCLTARHFSGRFLRQNPSLWASFMLEGRSTVYIGGDSGNRLPISRKSANGSRILTLPSSKTGNTTKTGGISIRCPNSFRQRFTNWMRLKSFRCTTANFHSPVTHGTSRSTASNRQRQKTARCM